MICIDSLRTYKYICLQVYFIFFLSCFFFFFSFCAHARFIYTNQNDSIANFITFALATIYNKQKHLS